jgi:hypothetical protein
LSCERLGVGADRANCTHGGHMFKEKRDKSAKKMIRRTAEWPGAVVRRR